MNTAEEKAKKATKKAHARKLKWSPKMQKALQQKSKKAKASQSTQSQKAKVKAKQSVQSVQSTSPFTTLMKSWETTAKRRASNEIVEKPIVRQGTSPMQSYLRPANIIGGGFGRTNTGMVPRFVLSYWERHKAI